jgi:ABC-type multidrug transport system ATPase subunit
LIGKLTVEEHLFYYSRLCGIPEKLRAKLIEAMIN